MPSYTYPATTLDRHACRLESASAFLAMPGEAGVYSSPIVDIPRDHLLVGPAASRLMLVHRLLMGVDPDSIPNPDFGKPVDDSDVFDLFDGLVENHDYQSIVMPGGRGVRTLSKAEADELAGPIIASQTTRLPTAATRDVWASLVSLLYSHGEPEVRRLAEHGHVFLARFIRPSGADSPGSGVASPAPLAWESEISPAHPGVRGWKIPSSTLLRMIDAALADGEACTLIQAGRTPAG